MPRFYKLPKFKSVLFIPNRQYACNTAVEFIALPGLASFQHGRSEELFYLRAELMLPEDYEVASIAF